MKIVFKYSIPYEKVIGKHTIPYVHFERAIKTLEQFWDTHGESIETELSKIANLYFKRESVTCYINSGASLSDPLSLRLDSVSSMQNTLIHELIHILFTDNIKDGEFMTLWDSYNKGLGKESQIVRSHVYLHAIHITLMESLFPHECVWYDSWHADYVRSFDIVKLNTPPVIIESFAKSTPIQT